MGFWSKIFGGGGGGGGADFYDKLLQLTPGETMTFSMVGKYVVGYGKFADRTVTLGEQYILAVTSAGRITLGDLQTMKPERARSFAPGTLRIKDGGFLDENGGFVWGKGPYTLAGPTGAMERGKVVVCEPTTGEPFALLTVASQVDKLLGAWPQ